MDNSDHRSFQTAYWRALERARLHVMSYHLAAEQAERFHHMHRAKTLIEAARGFRMEIERFFKPKVRKRRPPKKAIFIPYKPYLNGASEHPHTAVEPPYQRAPLVIPGEAVRVGTAVHCHRLLPA